MFSQNGDVFLCLMTVNGLVRGDEITHPGGAAVKRQPLDQKTARSNPNVFLHIKAVSKHWFILHPNHALHCLAEVQVAYLVCVLFYLFILFCYYFLFCLYVDVFTSSAPHDSSFPFAFWCYSQKRTGRTEIRVYFLFSLFFSHIGVEVLLHKADRRKS